MVIQWMRLIANKIKAMIYQSFPNLDLKYLTQIINHKDDKEIIQTSLKIFKRSNLKDPS